MSPSYRQFSGRLRSLLCMTRRAASSTGVYCLRPVRPHRGSQEDFVLFKNVGLFKLLQEHFELYSGFQKGIYI